jgi:hypothetical protein
MHAMLACHLNAIVPPWLKLAADTGTERGYRHSINSSPHEDLPERLRGDD